MYTLGATPAMFANLTTRTVAARPGPIVAVPAPVTRAAVTAATAAAVTPSRPVPPIALHFKSALMNKVIQKELAARAGQTHVRTGVPATLKNPLLIAAAQKAIAARSRMNPIAPVAPSVLEQTGISPPVTAAPAVTPSSPYSFVPDAGGGGSASAEPDVQQASMFPGDTTDQMNQVDQAAAAGDLSEQEVASIKADLASKSAAVPGAASWIPVALLVGLVGVAVIQSRRTGGRIGRRGWGD